MHSQIGNTKQQKTISTYTEHSVYISPIRVECMRNERVKQGEPAVRAERVLSPVERMNYDSTKRVLAGVFGSFIGMKEQKILQ